MTTQFFCKNKDRWKKVKESTAINGIDYLEVASEDQQTLRIYFLHDLPGQPGGIPANPALTKDNIFFEGGVRIKNIAAVDAFVDPMTSPNVLTVVVDKAGDFSTYTLKIGASLTAIDTPPDGFDEQLSAIDFSFKINCPNEYDCNTQTVCTQVKGEAPEINYLAKDYASFNRLMLDRLSSLLPDWKERNAADLQIALIELLAYVGDHLSYYQDAVATEAYIGTARRRISLKRHARLLDYAVHDGCNARSWIHIDIAKGSIKVNKGTVLLTNNTLNKTAITAVEKDQLINVQDAIIFETMHEIALHSEHNLISFYTWDDNNCCLPKGSTHATLLIESDLFFVKGDILIFEELYSPVTGLRADANPANRHVVRLINAKPGHDKLTNKNILEIEWDEADALPFSLCLTSSVTNRFEAKDELIPVNEKSVARGNSVLADYGITQQQKRLVPSAATENEKYYPYLPAKNITTAVAYNHALEKSKAAVYAVAQDPHKTLASVRLSNEQETWHVQRDLLASDRFATEFVVETEQDGTSYLRFGDDISGSKPSNGFSPYVTYRTGNGQSGNVGREAINAIEWKEDYDWKIDDIIKVRNPLPAYGGVDAESMEEIRQFAPQAFRTQQRAVTAADYVEKTQLHPQVQKAAAKFYWTGSWYTVYIIIDRKGGREIDDDFKQEITAHLEQYRMAGYDLEIMQPVLVPLDIVLNVCVKPGYFQANVKQSLIRVFSSQTLVDGSTGFFHPDNFTFGQPVYLSAIYRQAMSVAGVASVEIKKFNRWGKAPINEIENGLLQVAELEIIRVDTDPNFPENGKIDFIMLGGL